MSDNSTVSDDTRRQRGIFRVTIVGSIVNLLLCGFKLICGLLGHSSAMIADAAHSLSDLVSDLVVLLFVKLSSRPQDGDHDYGHGKYETLASVIMGVMLGLVGAGIFVAGAKDILRFINGQPIGEPGVIALVAAVVSMLVKEGLFQYTIRADRRLDSTALRANAWHHRSDALTSLAALIGIGGALLLGHNWAILDPAAAVIVSLFIVKAAFSLIKPSVEQLLEKALPDEIKQRIEAEVLAVDGVKGIHKLRTRRVGNRDALSMHLLMPGDITLAQAHDIATECERRLRNLLGKTTYINIHMEPA